MESENLHPVEKATLLHCKFVNIHPFKDGNGRTSRLIMNLEIMKNGYLPVNIEKDVRFKYYEVLDIAAVTDNYAPFIDFIANYEKESLLRYLSFIN
ncbi:Fic family protein [Peribacillus asahii]|uniref:Fic family protein n=1 Tax=Peribacillus asahii TaxID=228899 RepID=UPI00207AA69A|nr:Fic family protein [Peribacillus asahii]USK62350.1 Fic family protein [Peribacillus asahii]